MTRQQKIQAAIDALPHATGGEWLAYDYDGEVRSAERVVCRCPLIRSPKAFHPDGALISAAKDLAEEVVRLRKLVLEALEVAKNAHTEASEFLSDGYNRPWEERSAFQAAANIEKALEALEKEA